MTTINDGGPAFPKTGRVSSENRRVEDGQVGMTLRDYFAAHASITVDIEADGCINDRLAWNLMDRKAPSWDSDYLAAREYWAEAEARLRYMKADAMIAARGAE